MKTESQRTEMVKRLTLLRKTLPEYNFFEHYRI
jgi:hypothetical protein